VWLALIGCAAGGLLLAAGHLRPRFRQPLFRPGFRADLMHAAINGAALDLPIAIVLRSMTAVFESTAGSGATLLLADAPLLVQITVFVLVGDLLKWSIHALHHHVPLLWRLHQVHHSTRQMDALSHARSHPLEFVLNRVPFLFLFAVVLGIDLRVIGWYSAIDLVQGLWVHSNTRLPTGPLKFIFATQEFHQWHHADDPAAVNRNFGGFLSVWDWVFGTAYCPADRVVPAFGVAGLESPAHYREHLLLPFRSRRPRFADREHRWRASV
jgi:sterol desaturase/sphingolipid hydroxylase (fatty acid hydroxylase superfamily)